MRRYNQLTSSCECMSTHAHTHIHTHFWESPLIHSWLISQARNILLGRSCFSDFILIKGGNFCLSQLAQNVSNQNCQLSCTAGPPIMSFCYNTDEKNNRFPAGAMVRMDFLHSLHVRVGFLRGLRFPPTSQRCAREEN